MNEKTDFSINITVGSGTDFKPLTDWFAFDLCKPYAMPDGKLLLHNTRTGQRAMVMPEVYSTLINCIQFRTLDEHITHITELNPGMQGQQSEIRRVLQTMIDAGIMVSARKVCDALKQKPMVESIEVNGDNPVVVIITWERPEALERLLKSIVNNCKSANFHRLYIVDDSRTPGNIERNRFLAGKYAPGIEAPLIYFGEQQQLDLISGLVERLPEHENAIRFLISQSRWRDYWTSGLARNIALLLSCGHRLVMLDDDTICDVYEPVRPKPGIKFSDEPREAEFYSSEQEWAAQHQALNQDPIERHMQCLGLSLSSVLKVLGQSHLRPASFADSTALQVSELLPESVVLMTECGSLGCPGTGGNTWLPFMPEDSIKRMISSEQKTSNALHRRMAWTGRNQLHIVTRPNMSQITGFDNRHELPPYLPFIRGEDRLFGLMIDYIFPSSISVDYPWSIPHLPIPEREWGDEHRKFVLGESFPLFFFQQAHAHKTSCLADSPRSRMVTLAAWLGDLASSSDESLIATFRDSVLNDGAEHLQTLHEVLANADSAPLEWQAYLKDGISQLNAGMDRASSRAFQIKGLPGTLQDADLMAFWKQIWADFAEALIAWPAIRKAVGEIATD